MDLPAAGKKKYSFPVILGMNSGEPPSTRAARMKIYNDLVSQLDAGGAHYSQDLSEVDLSDAEDVKVLANDPQGAVLVHLGSSNYLERYKVYVSHVREWQQQFDKLESAGGVEASAAFDVIGQGRRGGRREASGIDHAAAHGFETGTRSNPDLEGAH
jgi:cell division protein FtsQ